MICLHKGLPVPTVITGKKKKFADGSILLGRYTKKNRIYLVRGLGFTMETLLHELAHHFVMTQIPEVLAHGTDFFFMEENVWATYREVVSWWNAETRREQLEGRA